MVWWQATLLALGVVVIGPWVPLIGAALLSYLVMFPIPWLLERQAEKSKGDLPALTENQADAICDYLGIKHSITGG